MAGRHESRRNQADIEKELQTMREEDLLQFIQETVDQLNRLGDRLETYAKQTKKGG